MKWTKTILLILLKSAINNEWAKVRDKQNIRLLLTSCTNETHVIAETIVYRFWHQNWNGPCGI